MGGGLLRLRRACSASRKDSSKSRVGEGAGRVVDWESDAGFWKVEVVWRVARLMGFWRLDGVVMDWLLSALEVRGRSVRTYFGT